MTEIGVLNGASVATWRDYFFNAHIWGVDLKLTAQARSVQRRHPHNITLFEGDGLRPGAFEGFGLANGTMDVVLDDGDHSGPGNIKSLVMYWPLVKPGGYLLIEDVATGSNLLGMYDGHEKRAPGGFAQVAHNEQAWDPEARRILQENDVFFTDTLVGHRDFAGLLRAERARTRHVWMLDRVNHNSHVLVVRRRFEARRGPVDFRASSTG